MIYTVTFNPSLDYIVDVTDFKTGVVNRTTGEKILQVVRASMFPWFLESWNEQYFTWFYSGFYRK